MVVSTATTLDLSQELATLLAGVEGLRVCHYIADSTRPPCAVIGMPSINWADEEAAFCSATWEFPILVATARNQDHEAQRELSRLVSEIAQAVDNATVDGVYSIQMQDARPTTATIAGQELPGYQLRVQVRA